MTEISSIWLIFLIDYTVVFLIFLLKTFHVLHICFWHQIFCKWNMFQIHTNTQRNDAYLVWRVCLWISRSWWRRDTAGGWTGDRTGSNPAASGRTPRLYPERFKTNTQELKTCRKLGYYCIVERWRSELHVMWQELQPSGERTLLLSTIEGSRHMLSSGLGGRMLFLAPISLMFSLHGR